MTLAELFNPKTAVETWLNAERPRKKRLAGEYCFTIQVKGMWHGFQTVIPAKAGIHGSKKTPVLHVFTMAPRFREDDAAEMLAGVGQASTAGPRFNRISYDFCFLHLDAAESRVFREDDFPVVEPRQSAAVGDANHRAAADTLENRRIEHRFGLLVEG
jgi:hypothetical protein